VVKPASVVVDVVLGCIVVMLMANLTVLLVAPSSEPWGARLVGAGLVLGVALLLAKLVLDRVRGLRSTTTGALHEPAPAPPPRPASPKLRALWWTYWLMVLAVCVLAVYVAFAEVNEMPWALAGTFSWPLIAVGLLLPRWLTTRGTTGPGPHG
jgi:hypothetical protein